jgi:thymidylate kinase
MKLKEEDSQAARPIPWFVLDAKKSIEDLHQEIVTIAKQVEQSNQLKPIDHLWV